MRQIKFRGRDMTGNFVYGLLTKKRIRSSGEIRWAIATGNCSLAETVPVNENSIAQLVGLDVDGREIYEGDIVILDNQRGVVRFANAQFYIDRDGDDTVPFTLNCLCSPFLEVVGYVAEEQQ